MNNSEQFLDQNNDSAIESHLWESLLTKLWDEGKSLSRLAKGVTIFFQGREYIVKHTKYYNDAILRCYPKSGLEKVLLLQLHGAYKTSDKGKFAKPEIQSPQSVQSLQGTFNDEDLLLEFPNDASDEVKVEYIESIRAWGNNIGEIRSYQFPVDPHLLQVASLQFPEMLLKDGSPQLLVYVNYKYAEKMGVRPEDIERSLGRRIQAVLATDAMNQEDIDIAILSSVEITQEQADLLRNQALECRKSLDYLVSIVPGERLTIQIGAFDGASDAAYAYRTSHHSQKRFVQTTESAHHNNIHISPRYLLLGEEGSISLDEEGLMAEMRHHLHALRRDQVRRTIGSCGEGFGLAQSAVNEMVDDLRFLPDMHIKNRRNMGKRLEYYLYLSFANEVREDKYMHGHILTRYAIERFFDVITAYLGVDQISPELFKKIDTALFRFWTDIQTGIPMVTVKARYKELSFYLAHLAELDFQKGLNQEVPEGKHFERVNEILMSLKSVVAQELQNLPLTELFEILEKVIDEYDAAKKEMLRLHKVIGKHIQLNRANPIYTGIFDNKKNEEAKLLESIFGKAASRPKLDKTRTKNFSQQLVKASVGESYQAFLGELKRVLPFVAPNGKRYINATDYYLDPEVMLEEVLRTFPELKQ